MDFKLAMQIAAENRQAVEALKQTGAEVKAVGAAAQTASAGGAGLAAELGAVGAAARPAATAMQQLGTETAGVSTANSNASRSGAAWAAQLNAEAASFDRLKASLFPAIAAQQQFAAVQAQVSSAVRAGVVDQVGANAVLEQARLRFTNLGPAADGVQRGAFAAGGGMRMLGQQLSQVAQQGAITGNYLGALAVQLPDMALGFGHVAIAASIVATVALPLIIGAFGGGKTAADRAAEANEAYRSSFQGLEASVAAATSLHAGYVQAVVSGNRDLVEAIELEARARQAQFVLDQIGQQETAKAAQEALKAIRQEYDATLQRGIDYQLQIGATNKLLREQEDAAKRGESGLGSINYRSQLDQQNLALEQSLELLKAQKAELDKSSAEWAVIDAQAAVLEEKMKANGDLIEIVKNGVEGTGSALVAATSAAASFTSQLSSAAGLAASIRSNINAINFGNIGAAAELAALQGGASPERAANAGQVASTTAKLRPMLDAGDNPGGRTAQNTAASTIADLSAVLETRTKTQAAITQWLKDNPTPGTGTGAGAGSGGGAASGSLDALQAEARKALDTMGLAVAGINEKVQAGLMSTAEGVDAVSSAKDRTANALADLIPKIAALGGPQSLAAVGNLRSALKDLVGDIGKAGSGLGATLTKSFEGAFASFLSGAKSGKEAFASFTQSILNNIATIMAQRFSDRFVAPLMGGILKIFGLAQGGVEQDGAIQAFAEGGVPALDSHRNQVVGSPTLFALGGGKTGLMGEAGPEAVMPLRRGPGGLSVVASGPGGETLLPLQRGLSGSLGVRLTGAQSAGGRSPVMDRAPLAFAVGGIVGGSSFLLGEQANEEGAGPLRPGRAQRSDIPLSVVVEITNQGPPVTARQTGQRSEGGKHIIEMLIEQTKGAAMSDIARGGDLAGVMEATYGLQRRGQ